MKNIILLSTLICIIIGLIVKKKLFNSYNRNDHAISNIKNFLAAGNLKSGDIIFQTSRSSQSKAIHLATKSKYSHCGIIYQKGKDFFVFEAVQPVKMTPLNQWISRGEDEKFVVKRLKSASAILTASNLEKLKIEGYKFSGKDYDLTFDWSDDKIYCSELIYKIYKRALNIEIGKLGKLKDFDFTNETVQLKMQERYGNNIPSEEIVISPAAIFNSDLLITTNSNY